MRPAFTRTEAWLHAGKYTAAVMSDVPRRNGWTIAKLIGDKTPDRTQRLLNRACWDEAAAMGAVRRFAVAGLDEAARRSGRGSGLAVGALDETGQEKHGTATAGVQRQHMGCAGGVENGINTVHLSYVREGTGHALIGARQWIPAGQIADPVRSLQIALPLDLQLATKGQLAQVIVADALADGMRVDFVCGDEVYGSCTQLRDYLEEQGQAYVLRVSSSFRLSLARGVALTCAQAVRQLIRDDRRWEIRSAGKGSKGDRWYAWACIATTSPRQCLLIRRHVRTGELAFHYCHVPDGQPPGIPRLIRAAGLRWPVEEDFVLQGRARAGPVAGPPLPCDLAAHHPGHGRPGRLRRHRRAPQGQDQHPGADARTSRPEAARRPRHDRPDSSRGPAAHRGDSPPRTTRPRRALVRLDPQPSGASTLVPPPGKTRPRPGPHPETAGQLANGGCRTRR
jgi:hypothetical protein